MNQLQWDIGTIRHVDYDEDGFASIQPDTFEDGTGGTSPYEMHSPTGLYALPLGPDVDDAGNILIGATVFYAMEGGRGHALPMTDPRSIAKMANMKPGETLLYNQTGQFLRLAHDGTITAFTTDDGTMTGRSVYAETSPTGFRWVAPWGSLIFDQTGLHVVHASGARFDLGGIYGVPGLPASITSYVSVRAASFDVLSPLISHGTGPNQEPLARASAVAELFALIVTAIGKLPLPIDPATLAAIQALLLKLPAEAVSS